MIKKDSSIINAFLSDDKSVCNIFQEDLFWDKSRFFATVILESECKLELTEKKLKRK